MKRIIICCDGTWNTPDQNRAGENVPTNVAKIADAVPPRDDVGTQQHTYYGAGVGAEGRWWRRMLAGATGLGLSRNLLDAYRFLVNRYAPGDELFLFGFSRGAFTVRSLAGFINNSGILRPEHLGLLERAYSLYTSRSVNCHPRRRECTLFRKTYAWQDRTPIRFIGVWDTVGALGNPLLLMKSPLSRRYRFHDTALSSTIEHAYHAIAIDEQRRHFRATPWRRQPGANGQVFEQRWFVGAHSDVGGGSLATGLSDIALEWMAQRAAACGLALDPMALAPDWHQGPTNSRTWFYRLIPRHHRSIGEMAAEEGGESVDDSARWRHDEDQRYRPPSLTRYLEGQTP